MHSIYLGSFAVSLSLCVSVCLCLNWIARRMALVHQTVDTIVYSPDNEHIQILLLSLTPASKSWIYCRSIGWYNLCVCKAAQQPKDTHFPLYRIRIRITQCTIVNDKVVTIYGNMINFFSVTNACNVHSPHLIKTKWKTSIIFLLSHKNITHQIICLMLKACRFSIFTYILSVANNGFSVDCLCSCLVNGISQLLEALNWLGAIEISILLYSWQSTEILWSGNHFQMRILSHSMNIYQSMLCCVCHEIPTTFYV